MAGHQIDSHSKASIHFFNMSSIRTMAALVATIGAAVANPVDLTKRETFSLTQVSKGVQLKSGPIQMAKTYQKYQVEIPSDVQAAAAAAVTGSATATPEDAYDSLYLTPVTVGTTQMMLDFDTGSADL